MMDPCGPCGTRVDDQHMKCSSEAAGSSYPALAGYFEEVPTGAVLWTIRRTRRAESAGHAICLATMIEHDS